MITSAKCSISDDTLRLIPGYDPFETAGDAILDRDAAQHAIDFFPAMLTHLKGPLARKPFHLGLWQQCLIGNLFGWRRPDGSRRYRKAFWLIPRKNGKSLMAAGICLYVLFCSGERGAEIYVAAAEREQASLVWRMAEWMIIQEPVLASSCRIYNASRSIVIDSMGSSFKPLSAEARTKHGYNAQVVIFDEVHAFRNGDLIDVLESSQGTLTEPLSIMLSTQDYDRPDSVCNEELEMATAVRDGAVEDPSLLPAIWETPRDADWRDPEVWHRANPNLGTGLSLDWVAAECRKAERLPRLQNRFKRLQLNMKTGQSVRWFDYAKWTACGATPVDPKKLEGRPCFSGLDLASISDLCAYLKYFPEDLHKVLALFWCPIQTARDRRDRGETPSYFDWADAGFMTLTNGNVTDYDVIRRDINQDREHFDVQEIAIDRWNSTQLQTQLAGDHFEVVPFGQGFASMSAPSKELERLTLSKNLAHGNNPVLNWNADNVAVEEDAAGNIKPSKRKSRKKIDGIVALIMGIGRSLVVDRTGSVYETRGILRAGDVNAG